MFRLAISWWNAEWTKNKADTKKKKKGCNERSHGVGKTGINSIPAPNNESFLFPVQNIYHLPYWPRVSTR